MYICTLIIALKVKELLCPKVRNNVWGDLTRFGKRAVVDIYPLGRECELNQPFVRSFDAWGNRTDELGNITGIFVYIINRNSSCLGFTY